MAETPSSGASTPNHARFMSQAATVEDRLKADTVGLVTLNDFRKRRAEAQEAAQDSSLPISSAVTADGRAQAVKIGFKKRKKNVKNGGLSFSDNDEDDNYQELPQLQAQSFAVDENDPVSRADSERTSDPDTKIFRKKSMRPNSAVGVQPKAMTKSSLLRELQLKEQLKKEYTQIQDAVKATEFVIPFVFYDGKNVPGGFCRMKKGDHIWLFLDRARKVGAGLAGKGHHARRDWARISVDDLMVVKGDIIIPHHYDFYFFIINQSVGYQGLLFSCSAEPINATPEQLDSKTSTSSSAATNSELFAGDENSYLLTAAHRKQQAAASAGPPDCDLEGYHDDPGATKVVDRRWYERNKHIHPASSWEEFDPARDYSSGVRKDKDGNAMFFSR